MGATIGSKDAFDLVVVGGGPVGIATACMLKAMNKNLKVCVLDKRPETTRLHGLHIDYDPIDHITQVLKESLTRNAPEVDTQEVKRLITLFTSWKNHVVPTNIIENELSKIAQARLGIEVNRGVSNTVTASLLDPSISEADTKEEAEIRQRLNKARVIIGADGSHSAVREAVKIEKTGQETLQKLLELKFQTPASTERRGVIAALFEAVKFRGIDFETLGKQKENKPTKPATSHIILDDTTFEHFQEKDKEGKITKGDFAHSWTFAEVEERAESDKKVRSLFKRFTHIFERMASQFKDPEMKEKALQTMRESAKISVLPMNIYRSEKAVTVTNDKIVILSGDAHSGVVFERGVNKGLHEAAFCAQALSKFFRKKQSGPVSKLPKVFRKYQANVKHLYEKEKLWAKFKSTSISIFNRALNIATWPFQKIKSLFKKLG